MILVSGGFDPIHNGHIQYLKAASQYGNVCVALNSDDWLIRKKGYVFQPWEVRKTILEAIKYVSEVVEVNDDDDTISDALRLMPRYFANGGDRQKPDEKEHAMCEKYGIIELFNVGGIKINSSSSIVNDYRKNAVQS